MKQVITREQYFDFIKQAKDTYELQTTETIYYLNLFDRNYIPNKPIGFFVKWHWFAFFLGPIWFAYRKMYLLSFLLLILGLALDFFNLGLFCMPLYGLSANGCYLRHIIKCIQQNKTSSKGQNSTIVWVYIFLIILFPLFLVYGA